MIACVRDLFVSLGLLLVFGWGIQPTVHGKLVSPYDLDRVAFAYGGNSEGLPSLEPLKESYLNLSFTEGSVLLGSLMEKSSETASASFEDLHLLGEVPVQYLKSLGYEGLVAFPDPNQIDPITGKDLRAEDDLELRILVWVSRLKRVRVENQGIPEDRFTQLQEQLAASIPDASADPLPLMQEQLRFWKRLDRSASRSSNVLLTPGDEPGQVVAVVRVKPEKQQGYFVKTMNAGTESTGEWIIGGSFHRNQLSAADDRLELSYFFSDTSERKAFGTFYKRPLLFPEVLTFQARAGYSTYDASNFAITRVDFEGETRSLDLSLRWRPLEFEGEEHEWSFELGVKGEQVEAENSLVSGRADAEMLTPRASVSLLTKGRYLRTYTQLELRGNLSEIDATDRTLLGGVGAEDRFARLSLRYMESLKIGKWMRETISRDLPDYLDGHLLVSRLVADYGLEKIRHLPQHQFISGGTGSVRGYPESPVAGDNGYFASMEYRIPMPLENHEMVYGTLIPFVDWSETFVNDPLSYESDRSLLGAGVGIDLRFSGGLRARLDFAKPLRDVTQGGTTLEGTGSGDSRVHAMIRWDF